MNFKVDGLVIVFVVVNGMGVNVIYIVIKGEFKDDIIDGMIFVKIDKGDKVVIVEDVLNVINCVYWKVKVVGNGVDGNKIINDIFD